MQLSKKITGAGTSTIRIKGVKNMHSSVHEVIPDRIEAGTYIMTLLVACLLESLDIPVFLFFPLLIYFYLIYILNHLLFFSFTKSGIPIFIVFIFPKYFCASVENNPFL